MLCEEPANDVRAKIVKMMVLNLPMLLQDVTFFVVQNHLKRILLQSIENEICYLLMFDVSTPHIILSSTINVLTCLDLHHLQLH